MPIPRLFCAALSAAFLSIAPNLAASHEFWIEPQKFQVEIGENIVADLRNGQEFVGTALAYFENQFTRFEMASGGTVAPVAGRSGDRPAMTVPADANGLAVIVHETTPSKVRYTEWAKFLKFAAHKDFPDIEARHNAAGFPRDEFRESYTRHAKALVAVGDGQGSDQTFGLKTEFVALTNPYDTNFNNQMRIQVLFNSTPRADAQVEVFHRSADNVVTITLHRTDADGSATIPVTQGDYLFDAVVLEPFNGEGPEDVVWQTYWAALTFQVPN